MSRAYVSLAISGQKPKVVAERAAAYKKAVKSFGFKVMLPTDLEACSRCKAGTDSEGHAHSWEEWMRVDLAEMMQHCDTIVMTPNWQLSHGARAELWAALVVGMRVCFLYAGDHDDWLLFDSERGAFYAVK